MAVDIPDDQLLAVLKPNQVDTGNQSGREEIVRALNNPIGSVRLRERVHKGDRVVIVTSDITRPLPTYECMPPLLDELYAGGVNRQDITLVFALGSHRFHTPEEMKKLAGERAVNEINVMDGDYSDCVHIGFTSFGTPVDIVRTVAEADICICLGNIEYHYFAGYSGGAKAIMPGVSTREAIQANHSRMVHSTACAGELDKNPVRLDIEEAAQMFGVDFILNVVLSEKKEILRAFAGDVVGAHREGCKFLDSLYLCEIPDRGDIVIVSQGGYPKDINLYQTQKALDNAKHAVKDGGIIILVGSCAEGLGEHVFEQWITQAETARSMVDRIQRDFQLGGHKAAAIGMVLESAEIYLVSDLPDELVLNIFLKPYSTVQLALDHALLQKGKDATIVFMPYGGSTLPRVKK